MHSSRGSTSVWPGYVAAAASLVLSLLLLAGVLVVAISQTGRMVEAYNRQLLAAVIEDEHRAAELDRLHKAAQPSPRREDASLPALDLLDRQLQQKSADLAKAQAELQRLELLHRQAAEQDGGRGYRFTIEAGAPGVDERVLREWRAAMARQAWPAHTRWVIEAGAKAVGGVAHRETYRLMMALRAQLQGLGFAGEQVRVVLDAERTPQEMAGPRSGFKAGDIVIQLRPDLAQRPRS